MKTNLNQILSSLLVLAVCSCMDDQSLVLKQAPEGQSVAISILTEGEELMIPDAQVQIYDGKILLAEFTSKAVINNFSFHGEVGKQYVVKVLKEDFETYTATFSPSALRKGGEAVMKVRMKPVLELTIKTWEENDTYNIDLDGTGLITIVWPDNTTQVLTMPFSTGMQLPEADGQKILIKGDISGITTYNAFGYNTAITAISGLKHLRNVTSFGPGRLILSEALDLRHGSDLKMLDVFESTLPDWLRLPKKHALSYITVTLSDRLITAGEIDELINNVYNNSIRRAIHGGTIHLTGSDAPSARAESMINILEAEYGWSIELNY